MKKSLFFVLCGVAIVGCASNMSYQQQTIIPALQKILKDKPLEAWLSQFEIPYWGTIVSVESNDYYHFLEFLFRKGMHFTGYGILAVVFYFFYTKLKWRYPSIFAFFTIVIIASLDEYRQSMIPGRTGIYNDVILDACGAITLLVIVKAIQGLSRLFKKNI